MVEGLLRSGGARGAIKVVFEETTGPSSYSAGGFTYTISGLKEVYVALVEAGGGYLAEVASKSGNTITIKVYQFDYPSTSAGVAVEATGADLSGVTFKIVAIGGV